MPGYQRSRVLGTVLLAALLAGGARAADEEAVASRVEYIELMPSFVLNYGGPASKLRYLRADISVRVNDAEASDAVRNHMPALRNEIVLLMSQQSVATMNDNTQHEALRLEALKRLQEVLKKETGRETVVDLFFINFVIQG